jgi:hypothetical protein
MYIVWSVESKPMFLRRMSPSSGSKNKPTKKQYEEDSEEGSVTNF